MCGVAGDGEGVGVGFRCFGAVSGEGHNVFLFSVRGPGASNQVGGGIVTERSISLGLDPGHVPCTGNVI